MAFLIPEASQLMLANNGDDYTHFEEIEKLFIKFAQWHVKAALEAAANGAQVTQECSGNTGSEYVDYVVDKQSILNAYPLEKIK
jgi:hypothetical protein